MVGKKNIVFGFIYILTTLGLGLYLANKLGSAPPEWLNGQQRAVLRAAHAHGNLESVLNILIGYLICRLQLEAWIAKTVSVLLIVGALFHSGMLYLGGFGMGWAFNLTIVGAVSLIATMLLMALGTARLRSID